MSFALILLAPKSKVGILTYDDENDNVKIDNVNQNVDDTDKMNK